MQINSRTSWGALAPKYVRSLSTVHNGWFWHWLGVGFPEAMSDEQILLSIQRYHMFNKEWSDVAYNWAIGRDADVYELRGRYAANGATSGFNNTSLAIVFLIGKGEVPTPEMLAAAWELMSQYPEVPALVRPHRDVVDTTCPGDEIAAEIANPQYKEQKMTMQEIRAKVQSLYLGILGREPDEGGWDYWTDLILEGKITPEEVLNEFLVVRLAADRAAFTALATKVDSGTIGGPSAQKVAEQAYRLFLDQLVAQASK